MNIFEKVQKAKELILEANLKKSGKNAFAGYTYYELGDILPKIVQVCNQMKLFTKVNFTDEVAVLEIINTEKPEEVITYTSPMKELNLKGANAIQALGGVETYQRRYLYMCAFDIVENDMFDASPPNHAEPAPKKESKKKATKPVDTTKAHPDTIAKMNEVIETYATKVGKDIETMKKAFIAKMGVKEASELTETQAQEITIRVAKQINK